ncbi:poly(hydroxyalkanoate) depolymerase family esterase [Paraburkholderia bannensis]|uniref:Poly(Hydroxyalkanoate) depolymerase family esterase n=1 Tax=Paraburkholderia bannensis TaxID=765414 RepID=A0A7W9TV05_9BURK|nr:MULTISPECIES: PHB depolymerase family esterase [Paraburkholderia]MBB3256988.1 poly(hydroxyalkanoate) depolymerase family esterase [Paraburkholderia sp. WP4_3_2]MBB6101942.1 poly(hydroxyalkanoate) depolymerase family esterase [Paraburkholderia bannensis]
MTKDLTKLWTGGMRRLFAIQNRAARTALREAGLRASDAQALWLGAQPAAAQANATATGRSPAGNTPTRPAPHAPVRESRVGPRAAAWASGEWERAGHLPKGATRTLAYGLYLPPDRPTQGMPVVVMLHGCKQTMDSFAEGTRMNLLADRHGFAVVYPEQSAQAHPHQCWHWYDARQPAGGGEAAAIVSLIDTLVEEHGFDRSRIYLAGLSAGAGLASLLAMRAPGRFAAVALHSGPAFGEARSGVAALDVMRRGLHHDPVALVDGELAGRKHPGMPALIVQGGNDAVVAPVNAEQLTVQFLHLNGLADGEGVRQGVVSHEHDGEGYTVHDYLRDGASIVRLCRVDGLDHAWSGGDDTVPFHSSAGPDASTMIWDFFETQRRAKPDEAFDDELAQDAG